MNDRGMTDEELLRMIRYLGEGRSAEAAWEEDRQEASAGEGSRAEVVGEDISIHYDEAYLPGDVAVEGVPPVRLFVNGVPVDGKTPLQKGDRVTWRIEEPPLFEIDVTPDGLRAFLRVRKRTRGRWKLKETGPAARLSVEGVEDEGNIVETLSSAAVIAKIQELGIAYNLSLPAIVREVSAPSFEPVLIAQGIEPVPSKDAELTLFFSEKVESVFRELGGAIDFKNHLRIPQASAGDRIAVRTAPVPGRSGRNVYNQPILPEPPADIPIRAGRHVDVTVSGEVFARKAGRPKMSGENVKRFEITTEHVIYGDVDLSSGNILFSGDVVVYGNVLEGMIIESLGNVYVFGNVYGSSIAATGSIYIHGNATNSSLYSGYFGVVYNRLYSQTKALSDQLEQVVSAAAQLARIVREKGRTAQIGQIVATLVQTKYAGLPEAVREALSTVSQIRKLETEEWADLRRHLEAFANARDFLALDALEPLQRLAALTKESFETIELMQEANVAIEFAQCNGSTIKSNGDIVVTNEGTFQSRLFARNCIVYKGAYAVCRGGELEAGGMISLMSVGGQSGGEAVIRSNKRISAHRIYMAKLCIGRTEEYIHRPIQNVNAYVTRGRLIVEGEAM